MLFVKCQVNFSSSYAFVEQQVRLTSQRLALFNFLEVLVVEGEPTTFTQSVRCVMARAFVPANVLCQAYELVLAHFTLDHVLRILMVSHVEHCWILYVVPDLPTVQLESLQVEHEHVRQPTQLHEEQRLSPLGAALTLVLVLRVERLPRQVLAQAAVKCGLYSQLEGLQRLVRDRLVRAGGTADH